MVTTLDNRKIELGFRQGQILFLSQSTFQPQNLFGDQLFFYPLFSSGLFLRAKAAEA
jgi:hypothetical protein